MLCAARLGGILPRGQRRKLQEKSFRHQDGAAVCTSHQTFVVFAVRATLMRCLAAAMLLTPAVASATVVGLCTPSETVFFSCATATKKLIGLCGSESGAIQYRFGTPARIEFRFPANPADAVASVGLTIMGDSRLSGRNSLSLTAAFGTRCSTVSKMASKTPACAWPAPLIRNGTFLASAEWSVDSPNYAACCTAIRIMR